MTEAGPAVRLASASPRRVAILAAAGFAVQQRPSGASEAWPSAPPERAALEVAARKLEAVMAAGPPAVAGAPTVAADTVVVVGAEVLGKPADAAAARAMLARLSGQRLRVVTGVVAGCGRRRWRRAVATAVWMRRLESAEIERYVATGEPLDKAGAWGLQGAGMALTRRVSGSVTNVLGLPLFETLAGLARLAAR